MILAIDPGKSGAIAYTDDDKIVVYKMPAIDQEVIESLLNLQFSTNVRNEKLVCYLEKVHAMPGQGVTSMFTFGQGYGFLRGVIQTLGIKLIDVSPQKWQGKLGLLKKSKDEIYQYVQQRNPSIKIHKYSADAVAILEYAIEVESK